VTQSSSVPAGWHPDPLPPQPGQPPLLRYWDGERWTEHTSPVPAGEQHPGQQYAGQQYYGGQSSYGGDAVATTPDGVPLAGWWSRVGATLIDAIILFGIYLICWIPFYGGIVDGFSDYFDDVARAADEGRSAPAFEFTGELATTLAVMGMISLVVSVVWTFAWLRTKSATPGKLALGLRVRLRDTPGQLSYGTIFMRWLTQSGAPGAVSLVPIVGNLVFLYTLLDSLWPLWDGKKQAIHDKAAKTNVVKVR
jgi:uncharacterized RDD family membrane protein YckC